MPCEASRALTEMGPNPFPPLLRSLEGARNRERPLSLRRDAGTAGLEARGVLKVSTLWERCASGVMGRGVLGAEQERCTNPSFDVGLFVRGRTRNRCTWGCETCEQLGEAKSGKLHHWWSGVGEMV